MKEIYQNIKNHSMNSFMATIFIFGGLNYLPQTVQNNELSKVSDGPGLKSTQMVVGGEAMFGNFGVGGQYKMPQEVKSYLNGLDGSKIDTGYVKENAWEVYGIAEKMWDIHKLVDIGGRVEMGLEQRMRDQNGEKVNSMMFKGSAGPVIKVGNKVYGEMVITGGTDGLNIKGGVGYGF